MVIFSCSLEPVVLPLIVLVVIILLTLYPLFYADLFVDWVFWTMCSVVTEFSWLLFCSFSFALLVWILSWLSKFFCWVYIWLFHWGLELLYLLLHLFQSIRSLRFLGFCICLVLSLYILIHILLIYILTLLCLFICLLCQ